MIELQTELAPFFFMEHPFHLKEQLTDKLCYSNGVLMGIFLKMTEMRLTASLKKQLTVLVANDTSKAYKKILNFRKLVSTTMIWLPNT